MRWQEREPLLYRFILNKEGVPSEVNQCDFFNFLNRSIEYCKFKGCESLDDFKGREVRITSGVFANYDGVVEVVKKDKLGVRVHATISILVWVDRKYLVLL